ncbi:MAG TPA: hypothetical protein VGE37_14650 [Archangium sp.]
MLVPWCHSAGLVLLQVDEPVMLAWAEAVDVVHSGDPSVAKKLVADVVSRWPAFTPAVERLAQLWDDSGVGTLR